MAIDGRSALPLATEGTQEFVLRKKEGLYVYISEEFCESYVAR